MNSFKYKRSYTKNWPGGRKKAVIITDLSPTQSVPLWNKETSQFTKPYWPIKEEVKELLEEATEETENK